MRDRVFQHKCQNQKHQKYPISHVMGVPPGNGANTFLYVSIYSFNHNLSYRNVFVSLNVEKGTLTDG